MSTKSSVLRVVDNGARSPWLLKATLFSMLVFPPYMVFGPIGASGSVTQVLALALFALWIASSVLSLHNPLPFAHPGRAGVLFLLLASCTSYLFLFAGLSGASTVLGRNGADRWMILMLASAAVAFTTTECIHTVKDAMALVRWVLRGASFCCIIALLQFVTRTDPMTSLTPLMVGFVENSAAGGQQRGMFLRVTGTTMHPIELGVVISMLLPLSVWRAIYDHKGWKPLHWAIVALGVLTNAMTISRSALIGLVIATAFTVPFLPKLAQRWSAIVIPSMVAALFLSIPGLLTTLAGISTVGNSDSSITYRTNDYPLALRLVTERPWFGIGPGTWIPTRPIDNFDNEYLLVSVTLGAVGLVAFLAYLFVPFWGSLVALWYAKDREVKLLSAAAASAAFIAAVTSGTFDSMSFPVFALLLPFFIGLSGACWLIVKSQMEPSRGMPPLSGNGAVPRR